MGQPVTVVEKPTSRRGVVRFEINRTVSGMGHEVYRSAADADAAGDAPSGELARRLFAHGGVTAVSIYSNVITVHLADGGSPAGIKGVIEDLYLFYTEGVVPTVPT